METILTKKIKSNTILRLFDSDLINIRYYNVINYKFYKVKNLYQVKIRHTEKENAEELLLNSIKIIENGS